MFSILLVIIFEFYIGRGIVASVIKYVVAYHSENHPRGGGGEGEVSWICTGHVFTKNEKHCFVGKFCFPPTYSVFIFVKNSIYTFWFSIFETLRQKTF